MLLLLNLQKLGPAIRDTACLLPFLAAASLFGAVPTVFAQAPTALVQQGPSGDPPGRVARVNLAEGPVSFASGDRQENSQGDANWTPAVLNRPMTGGDRLWTGQRARSELHIGSTAVRLGEQTSLDFLTLDDDVTLLRLAQGTMKLRVRALFEGQRIEINTPNLAFVISQPGDYRVDAVPATNTSAGSTRVVVQQGAGVIYGDRGASVNIAAGQQANFTDTQLRPAGYAPEVQDSFDTWALQRDRLEDQSVSARYIPREVVGYQQLDTYGDWSQDPTYGPVWLPRAVPANWAPYRAGHWSWVAPWGWTWVDDAPWGFAPFHYGRWAQIGPRWGWVPGQLAPRPIYAPALVAFIGGSAGGANWNVSLGQQAARPGLGWFPLAPGEAWRPGYRASPRYVSQANHNIVVNNFNHINNDYRYQRQNNAVSAMSAADFARGQPVRGNQQDLSPADLGRAQVLSESRGALPQRVIGIMAQARPGNPVALPPAAVSVRPVVGIPPMPGRRDELREPGRDGGRNDQRNDQRDGSRDGRPGNPQGALPDRGPLDAGQRDRMNQQRELQEIQQGQQREQERQQREVARQQQERAAGQRQLADESMIQRAVREQAQRNANPPDGIAFPQGRPGWERNNQVQPLPRDPVRPPDESIGQRAVIEQVQRQAQAQQQAQQAQQRAQQDQQRQAREQQAQQQQQQQRQQQDQARQQQAAQAQQQQVQQQAQQAQQRAQQDQQRQARETQRQPGEPARNLERERQPQRQPEGINPGRARLEDFNPKRE